MKISKLPFLAVILIITAITSCRKDDFPEGTTGAYSAPESVQGIWTLQSVTQVDESAKSSNFPLEVQSLDLKTVYNFEGFKAEFKNLDSEGKADFTITNPGNAPIFMPASGKWSFKTDEGPIQLQLAGADSTYYGEIKPAYRASENKLAITMSRKVNGAAQVSYVYYFTR
jgi:Domain of unknown function (DUF5004)